MSAWIYGKKWWVIEDWTYVNKHFTFWGKVAWITMVILHHVGSWVVWALVIIWGLEWAGATIIGMVDHIY